jgi:hypothetical protein
MSIISLTRGGRLNYHSVQFPNGMLITGHSRCCAALRHFTSGIIPFGSPLLTHSAQSSINLRAQNYTTGATPSINPLVSYSNLADPSVRTMITSSLKKVSGVYAFQLISTGEIVYVGSSVCLARRFLSHFNGGASNIILQRAFAKYGISAFNFIILEEYRFNWDIENQENQKLLLALEQKYLDSLNPPYNIAKRTNAPFAGQTHSDTARAAISSANQGSKNPMFGTVSPNAEGVAVFALDGALVATFTSMVDAAKFMGVSHQVVSKAVKRNYVVKGQYRVVRL